MDDGCILRSKIFNYFRNNYTELVRQVQLDAYYYYREFVISKTLDLKTNGWIQFYTQKPLS